MKWFWWFTMLPVAEDVQMAQLMGHCRSRAGKLSSIMDYSPAACKAQLNVIAPPCEQAEQFAYNRSSDNDLNVLNR
ncbi:hypothetical protein AAES_162701 [Amazona aestiva]|uniref:Uncharacterized protein n=1 Tax=Amazona aestiva TaxID=12930 RepID=A0A0Q3PCS5_AMAAE|nr:hypothetical protein AAES_162701 [Amazona aestiva]